MPYSLVVSDVSVTRGEDDIKHELMQEYRGVLNVIRWYFDDAKYYPTSCVQIDFDSKENIDKVLNDGTILIDSVYRRISNVLPRCYRCQKTGHKVHNCQREPLNEKDLIKQFAEQKQ
jgi:hypothetical protein